MTSDINFAAGWLRGFWDGEGSVRFRTDNGQGKKHAIYGLDVGNTDPALMEACTRYLAIVGIEFWTRTRRQRPPRQTFYELHITRGQDMLRFAEIVGFDAPAKAEIMRRIVAHINRPRTGHIERFALKYESDLRSLYPNHTLRCIGDYLGIPRGTHGQISHALKFLGLNRTGLNQGSRRCITHRQDQSDRSTA